MGSNLDSKIEERSLRNEKVNMEHAEVAEDVISSEPIPSGMQAESLSPKNSPNDLSSAFITAETSTEKEVFCSSDLTGKDTEEPSNLKLAKYLSHQTNNMIDLDYLARSQHAAQDIPEVKSFVIALLELVFEKQSDISSAAMETIQKIGHKHPATVLRTVLTFLSGESKPSTRVRSLIFSIMDSTINPAVELGQLDTDLAAEIIKLTLDELLSQQEPILDIQLPAANALVSIGAVYCRDLVQVLINRLQTPSLPHPSVISILASLATTNIYGTVPHLRGALELLLAHMKAGKVKTSAIRANYATALAKFSEALAFYFANKERAPDGSIKPDSFHEGISDAFEIVSSQWLPCKSKLTCQEILEALGQMSQLLPKERLDLIAPKVLPSLLQSYRGPVEPLYVSKALALFLDAFFQAKLELAEVNLQEMLQSLFSQATINPDYSQPSTVKNHYEVHHLWLVFSKYEILMCLFLMYRCCDVWSE